MKKVVFLFVLISAMLLSSQTVKADELYSSTYYSGTAYSDHFNVSLLIADLHGRDTWITTGYIKAYDLSNSARSLTIANVYTWDQHFCAFFFSCAAGHSHRHITAVIQSARAYSEQHLRQSCHAEY